MGGHRRVGQREESGGGVVGGRRERRQQGEQVAEEVRDGVALQGGGRRHGVAVAGLRRAVLGSSDRLRVAVHGRLLLEDDVGAARPWRMGMAARGCGAVLRTAATLSEWRGRPASNAACGDKVATAAGCRTRHGL
jgi:hypothetical protein